MHFNLGDTVVFRGIRRTHYIFIRQLRSCDDVNGCGGIYVDVLYCDLNARNSRGRDGYEICVQLSHTGVERKCSSASETAWSFLTSLTAHSERGLTFSQLELPELLL